MPSNPTAAAASALVVGGLLAAPALHTQAAGPGEGGMMGRGGPVMDGGMTAMMERMNRMMATCAGMMQAHMADHGHGGPAGQGWMPRHEEAPALPPASPEDRG